MKYLTYSLAYVSAVYGHGATSYPPSRSYLCSTANGVNTWNAVDGPDICAKMHNNGHSYARYNWNGINQLPDGRMNVDCYADDPRCKHVDIMANGLDSKICSAGLDVFASLDDTLWAKKQADGKYPEVLKTGLNTFKYQLTAAHKTYSKGYLDVYITKSSWDGSTSPTWNDLERKPICHWVPEDDNTPIKLGGVQDWPCTIPDDKVGQYLLYTVWQRDDSPEAFYSCSDVFIETADDSDDSGETDDSDDSDNSEGDSDDSGDDSDSDSGDSDEEESSSDIEFCDKFLAKGKFSIVLGAWCKQTCYMIKENRPKADEDGIWKRFTANGFQKYCSRSKALDTVDCKKARSKNGRLNFWCRSYCERRTIECGDNAECIERRMPTGCLLD